MMAEDVVFTYNFYASHEDFPYMPVYTVFFESVEAPDDRTVVITLTEPIPNMESQLFYMYILPQHIWAEHDTPEGAAAGEAIASRINETIGRSFEAMSVPERYMAVGGLEALAAALES